VLRFAVPVSLRFGRIDIVVARKQIGIAGLRAQTDSGDIGVFVAWLPRHAAYLGFLPLGCFLIAFFG
jgi:hypothetical protein